MGKNEFFPRVGQLIKLNTEYVPAYSCSGEKQYFTITHKNKYCMSRHTTDWDDYEKPWVSVKIQDSGIYKITYEGGGLQNIVSLKKLYNQGFFPESAADESYCRGLGSLIGPLIGQHSNWYGNQDTRDALICCSVSDWRHYIVTAGWNYASGLYFRKSEIPIGGVVSLEDLEAQRKGEANYFFSSGAKELWFYYTGSQYDGPSRPLDFAEGAVIYSIQKVGNLCGNISDIIDQEFE